jgi:cytochrome c oxidase assembly factor CtaG
VSWTTWDFAPLVLVGAAIALLLFLDAFLLLRRRGRSDHAGWSRAALFVLAVALGTLPLVSPLDEAGDTYLLSAHVLQHVLISDVAPALALVALRGPLVFFFPPNVVLRRVAHRARVRRLIVFVLRPRVSLALWAGVIGAWHVPAPYDYALAHPIAHDLEHLSFIAVGLLAWTQIVDPGRRKTLDPAQRLVCASAMLLFTLALGGLLFFADPLYSTYVRQGTRLFALSPAADQRLAGLVMIGEQLLAFAVCAGFLLPALGRGQVLREAGRGTAGGDRDRHFTGPRADQYRYGRGLTHRLDSCDPRVLNRHSRGTRAAQPRSPRG